MSSTVNKFRASKIKMGKLYLQKQDERKCKHC